MSGSGSPVYGTPEPGLPVGGVGVFVVRHQRREAVTVVLGGVFIAGVVGFGLGVVGQFLTGGPADAPAAFRVLPVVIGVVLGLVGLWTAGRVVSGLVRSLRRGVVLRLDEAGVTLERRRWWQRDRVVPWRDVRALTLYSVTGGDHERVVTTDWFQVDLRDASIERRRLARDRHSWPALVDVVRTVAPGTDLRVDGAPVPT